MNKKKGSLYVYDVDDPFDEVMALDVPNSQLNAQGRKRKKALKKLSGGEL